jgi:hypothetical protein
MSLITDNFAIIFALENPLGGKPRSL